MAANERIEIVFHESGTDAGRWRFRHLRREQVRVADGPDRIADVVVGESVTFDDEAEVRAYIEAQEALSGIPVWLAGEYDKLESSVVVPTLGAFAQDLTDLQAHAAGDAEASGRILARLGLDLDEERARIRAEVEAELGVKAAPRKRIGRKKKAARG